MSKRSRFGNGNDKLSHLHFCVIVCRHIRHSTPDIVRGEAQQTLIGKVSFLNTIIALTLTTYFTIATFKTELVGYKLELQFTVSELQYYLIFSHLFNIILWLIHAVFQLVYFITRSWMKIAEFYFILFSIQLENNSICSLSVLLLNVGPVTHKSMIV